MILKIDWRFMTFKLRIKVPSFEKNASLAQRELD
jgi:hypothetical protein